jgi:hypothetical protein
MFLRPVSLTIKTDLSANIHYNTGKNAYNMLTGVEGNFEFHKNKLIEDTYLWTNYFEGKLHKLRQVINSHFISLSSAQQLTYLIAKFI